MQAALWPGEYDLAVPMLCEVVVAHNDPVWSLWEIPGSESQSRPLKF